MPSLDRTSAFLRDLNEPQDAYGFREITIALLADRARTVDVLLELVDALSYANEETIKAILLVFKALGNDANPAVSALLPLLQNRNDDIVILAIDIFVFHDCIDTAVIDIMHSFIAGEIPASDVVRKKAQEIIADNQELYDEMFPQT